MTPTVDASTVLLIPANTYNQIQGNAGVMVAKLADFADTDGRQYRIVFEHSIRQRDAVLSPSDTNLPPHLFVIPFVSGADLESQLGAEFCLTLENANRHGWNEFLYTSPSRIVHVLNIKKLGTTSGISFAQGTTIIDSPTGLQRRRADLASRVQTSILIAEEELRHHREQLRNTNV